MDDLVKTNETSGLIPFKEVEDKIAIIRNQEVIADADVAHLFGVQTKEVNQAVRNNPDKFPQTYMFELSKSELHDLRSKILTTKVSRKSRSATKAFTEKGLYMIATILRGERALGATFAIIETFAKVRELKRQLLELHQETDKETKRVVYGNVLLVRQGIAAGCDLISDAFYLPDSACMDEVGDYDQYVS